MLPILRLQSNRQPSKLLQFSTSIKSLQISPSATLPHSTILAYQSQLKNNNASSPTATNSSSKKNIEFLQQQHPGPEPNYTSTTKGHKTFKYLKEFKFIHGGSIPEFTLAYETWGELNQAKDNVILLHTGLSASSHAKSHERNPTAGWWENFIGPGKSLDTNKFHIICTNVLGGCYGSTGPSSINPNTNKRYAATFPVITIPDMINAQFKLLDYLNIQVLYASLGSSMGGLQSLCAASMYPHRIQRLISISAAARSAPSTIALRHCQRQILMSDANWAGGDYYDGAHPSLGMKLARQVATISYRSGPEWEQRFGRQRVDTDITPHLNSDFLIESYLDHQGVKFCYQYDPNSLLYISKAMDLFDMSERELWTQRKTPANEKQHNNTTIQSLINGVSTVKMPTLIVGVQSDTLFPVWQQKEVSDVLKASGNLKVSYYEIDALYGHDTFLIDEVSVGGVVKGFLEIR